MCFYHKATVENVIIIKDLPQVAQREKERQEAIARGEPDPELKRKRFFPQSSMSNS